MCPLLTGLMRSTANEVPASETKYLSKPSGCITIKLPQTARVRTDAPPTPSQSSKHGPLDQQSLTSTFRCHSGFCFAEVDGCRLDAISVFVWGWRIERGGGGV